MCPAHPYGAGYRTHGITKLKQLVVYYNHLHVGLNRFTGLSSLCGCTAPTETKPTVCSFSRLSDH
jgi:hypothetical protein